MSESEKTHEFAASAILGAMSGPMLIAILLGKEILTHSEVFAIADNVEDLLVSLSDDDLPPALRAASLKALGLLRNGPWAPVGPQRDR